MNKFKIGDIVSLKSGGPEMTVTAVNESSIRCMWFIKDGMEYAYDNFDPEVLQKINFKSSVSYL